MASYEHKGRSPKVITLEGCRKGLGVRITGGRNMDREEHFGIFIKEVLVDSLAARDGQLREGDQLLEANGQSLVDVSNQRAVEILKCCTATDCIKLLISRDAAAQSQYRRLSDALAADTNSPLPPANTPKAPITSTPFRNDDKPTPKGPLSAAKQNEAPTPSNVVSDSVNSPPWGSPLQSPNFESSSAVMQWQKQSTSASKPPVMYPSEEQGGAKSPSSASSSDSGSHDENGGHAHKKPPSSAKAEHALYDGSQVALSDVILSETTTSPLQKPISLSPLHERGVDIGSSPQPAVQGGTLQVTHLSVVDQSLGSQPLPLDHHTTADDVITIPKDKGLGISIAGGVGRPDGPGIYIAKILDGLDAFNNNQLRVGDQILKVNGESFECVQLEKAKHLLTQMKTRQHVSNYIIQIKRQPYKSQATSTAKNNKTSPASALTPPSTNQGGTTNKSPSTSPQPHTSPQSHTSPRVSVFDSSTLVVTNDKPGPSPTGVAKEHSPIPRKRTRLGNSERTSNYDSMRQRLSVDTGGRFKLTKLEYALNYIGYTVTPERQEQFRKLDIDEQGKVVLADFIALCKEMFPFESGSGNLNFESQLTLALTQKESLDFPRPNAVGKTSSLDELLREFTPRVGEAAAESDESDFGTPVKPVTDGQMQQVGPSPKEEELKKKLAMTEKALKASKKKERDLKNMVGAMEEELSTGRQNNHTHSSAELQRRLAVLDCERKKEQATTRRYQVATEKLLMFAEECHDILVNSPDASRTLFYVQGSGQSTLRGDQVTGNPRPPRYLSKHAKETAVTLAQKAKEVSLSVREILKTEELPFGWEKCFNEAGVLYYINHQTQSTSWSRPLADVSAEAHHTFPTAAD